MLGVDEHYLGWFSIGVHAGVEALAGQLIAERAVQLERLAILAGQGVGQRIEVQTAGQR